MLRFPTLSALGCAALLAVATPVHAQSTMPAPAPVRPAVWDIFTLENIARSVAMSLLSSARVLADIRYDAVSFDPMLLRLSLAGADIRPILPWGPDACRIRADRLTLSSGALDRIENARVRLSMDGAEITAACMEPEVAGMMAQMGLDPLQVPRLDADLNYDYASGGGTLRVVADIDRLALAELFVEADYFSYRMDYDTEEPVVALDLNTARLTLDDKGAWEMGRAFLPPEMQQPGQLAGIVAGGVQQALQEGNGFDDPALTAKQRDFATAAGNLAAGFGPGQRIVLSTGFTGAPVKLSEATLDRFKPLFEALAPTITGHAPALDTGIAVADLQAALNASSLPANALDLGRAFATGIGAPRNLEQARRFLEPVANDAANPGHGAAALLLARALEATDPAGAYGRALRAGAARTPGALALLDRLEGDLGYEAMLGAQNGAMAGGPEEALFDSPSGMIGAARAFFSGSGRARAYRAAYYWASMAAAAGDASGAALRDEIDELMRLRGDGAAWAAESASLENGVLRDWLAKDVPARMR